MNTNTTNEHYLNEDSPLAEPHFDEEVTVLSARPVVPLDEIKAEERSQKRLIVGLAMVCLLLGGALGAALIYKQNGQKPSGAQVDAAIPGATGIALAEPASGGIAEDVAGAVNGTSPQVEALTVGRQSVSSKPAAEATRKKPLHQQVDERELSRNERREVRRLKRRAEREAGTQSDGRPRRPDDLLRIREIFEGPSRP